MDSAKRRFFVLRHIPKNKSCGPKLKNIHKQTKSRVLVECLPGFSKSLVRGFHFFHFQIRPTRARVRRCGRRRSRKTIRQIRRHVVQKSKGVFWRSNRSCQQMRRRTVVRGGVRLLRQIDQIAGGFDALRIGNGTRRRRRRQFLLLAVCCRKRFRNISIFLKRRQRIIKIVVGGVDKKRIECLFRFVRSKLSTLDFALRKTSKSLFDLQQQLKKITKGRKKRTDIACTLSFNASRTSLAFSFTFDTAC